VVQRLSAIATLVAPITFDWALSNAAALIVIAAEAYAVHRDLLRTRWEGYGMDTRSRLLAGSHIDLTDYMRARQVRAALRETWEQATRDIDFVVMPTLPTLAGPEEDTPSENLAAATLYTSTFASLGLPAISLPAGLSADGRPVGLQIIGHVGHDADVLGFALQVEDLCGPLPHPPLYADMG
jgi:aspartyl-tRNA(Asn)/glutamyl-tRNA(Gln) amidotransferase subunit A